MVICGRQLLVLRFVHGDNLD